MNKVERDAMRAWNEPTFERISDRWIEAGNHWLIFCDRSSASIQVLTDHGYTAVRTLLATTGCSQALLTKLGRKRHGHYYVAVMLPMSPKQLEQLAASLAKIAQGLRFDYKGLLRTEPLTDLHIVKRDE